MITGYFLGCPSWGLKDWVGNLYRRGTRPGAFLDEYARVFNAVEGNTTFYGVPKAASVKRWCEATPPGFRFCFKIPQSVTHRQALTGAEAETEAFLERMAPLGERLGPFMVQLPPWFGPERLEALDRFLRGLPGGLDFAVELRHPRFYGDEPLRRLDDLLAERGVGRVVLDTRPLRGGDPSHPDAAGCDKPDLPIRPPTPRTTSFASPILRFISHPDDRTNDAWIELWSAQLRDWIDAGWRPYVFVHCPNDLHAPRIARRLHQRLETLAEVGTMPPWPGETDTEAPQLSLW